MDSFQVRAKDTTVLGRSHLVQELQQEVPSDEIFPVLIGEQVTYFHDIDGGFSSAENSSGANSGYHIVNLIHRVQGVDSPPNKHYADTIEIHLNEWFYSLDIADIFVMDEYPDDDFVLSLKVTDYMMGNETFSEALTADVDKREQEFGPNGEKS